MAHPTAFHAVPGCSSGAQRHPRNKQRLSPCPSFRGPPGYKPAGFPGLGSGGGGLILPGGDAGTQDTPRGGGLIIPGQEGRAPSKGAVGGPGVEGERRVQNFRPPTGFMDMDPSQLEDETNARPEEMLMRLRNGAGRWHELARLLPKLLSMGYESFAVEEATGLERRVQGVWGAALPVYTSLKGSGFPEDKLSFFDRGGDELLYEIRFLTAPQRTAVATYIVDNELTMQECTVLARAVKEHERRRAEREGFSAHPGDCLAYKHYRDALECRKDDQKEACIQRGLAVAVTDCSRKKLSELRQDKTTTAVFDSARITVTMLRLLKEEQGYRPVAVAGVLGQACEGDVASAPVALQRGAFGAYVIPGSAGIGWVPLPGWNQLLTAVEPVALEIPDCSAVPVIVAASFVASDDDRKRLATPGLLVVDRRGAAQISADNYYVAERDGRLQLLDGRQASEGAAPVGRVLFCARPPQRDADDDEVVGFSL